jgi:hypothetical protein
MASLEPVVIIGGFLSGPSNYTSWQRILARPPFRRRSFVAPINLIDWTTTRDESFRPQLTAIEKVVEQARRSTGAEKVWLLCHSAGGRLARLWMGDKSYAGNPYGGHAVVRGVMFFGTPYTTAEPWAVRSAGFANENYPGAFYPDIKYVSLIGKSIVGRRNGSIEERLAYRSYVVLDPQHPERWGDGVITLDSAYVPEADNFVLDGIHHVSVLGRPGYAAPGVLKLWTKYLVDGEAAPVAEDSRDEAQV